MGTLDYQGLAKDMAAAALGVLKRKKPEIAQYVTTEMQKLAIVLRNIETQYLAKEMTEEQAKLQIGIARNSAQAVLTTAKGLGKLAAERAINAALDVAKTPVNKAVGFPLL